ncbi:MAG TPA: hypothetical protein VGX94_11415 [Terriglobia bacterium]|nr:hypothetical protein [Terriglobia bacterium]
MGSPLVPVGAAPMFIPSDRAARGKGGDPVQPPGSRRQSDSRASRDSFAAQTSNSASDQAGTTLNGSGVYEVAASLALQQQLYVLTTTGAGGSPQIHSDGANQGTNQGAAPKPNQGDEGSKTGVDGVINATLGESISVLAAAGDGPGTGGSTPAPATSNNSQVATGAVTNETGTPASSASSATLKQEEAQLQQALEALGLNPPAAIQEFMQAAQLLAEISPGMFQEFVSTVSQLAEAAEPAAPVSPAAGSAVESAGSTAAASSAAPSAGAPQIQLEFGSVQVTQAEVSITTNQNGGETLSLEAQSETASFAQLQLGSPAQAASPSSPSQNSNTSQT